MQQTVPCVTLIKPNQVKCSFSPFLFCVSLLNISQDVRDRPPLGGPE